MEYNFQEIERAARQLWQEQQVYRVTNESNKPKFYVLDMFPYPSGAGLHVGHPLGYIASDIYARYKAMKGYNVLHPMGFDAFGLPAEQYALETGQHPAVTTEKNISRYKEQLDNIGFNYDWSREVRTSDHQYYKWTQWIFGQLFQSWFNRKTQKAEPINELIRIFEQEGNISHSAPGDETCSFSSAQWMNMNPVAKRNVLMQYRLAYLDHAEIWWCEALGTVLANDEVVNGVSERGGYPVEKKKMHQWFLRITEYADRLIDSLDTLEWSDAMKEMQRNWIGKSEGAEIDFYLISPPPSLGGGAGGEENRTPDTPKYYTTDAGTWNANRDMAKDMRHNPTEAEHILWQQLKNKKLGFKFRRQHPVLNFIPDFVCLEKKLIVEADGDYRAAQQEYDEDRTKQLNNAGYVVIRFTNDEVLNNIAAVLSKVKSQLENLPSVINNEKEQESSGSLSSGEGLDKVIKVFTTRPDTIFGVDFMVLAPEHELVPNVTTATQQAQVAQYVAYVKSRSERERMAEKKVTGCFTGAYCLHPFSGKEIPIWISEYVLAGYGTGAIMAVPSGDDRDHAFATHFGISVTNIFGEKYTGDTAVTDKNVRIENSDFISGMEVKAAAQRVLAAIRKKGIGESHTNYKLRDAGFSRQRYWGEPFPIIYKNNIPYLLNEPELQLPVELPQLPVELPHVDHYKPGPEGEGPLANISNWVYIKDKAGETLRRETNTMPGYAGSSWYFLRYMDPHNDQAFADRNITDYWNQVDLYIGGTEHAVGHLLYSRMWTKVLYDLGYLSFDEPFKRLVNQGMIGGNSRLVYRVSNTNIFVSSGLKNDYKTDEIHVDVNIVDGIELDIEQFKKWREEYHNAEFILENEKYLCGTLLEKMSKRYYNVVNPDDIVAQYGADTFRMYEMFLGPVEMSKPWDTKGIEGVHRFLKKLWRLFYDERHGCIMNEDEADPAELKVLHKTVKKIGEDVEKFSFNTAVSQFMICVNDLTELHCHKKAILNPLIRLLSPFAPHLAEFLWQESGNSGTVVSADFPNWDAQYTVDNTKVYPIAINGKARTELEFPLDAEQGFIELEVLQNEIVQKWMEGKPLKKFIYVKGRMINVVV